MKNRLIYSKRQLILILIDIFVVAFAYILNALVCHSLFTEKVNSINCVISIIFALLLYVSALLFSGVYGLIWRYAQETEFFQLLISSVAAGFMYFFADRYLNAISFPFYFYVLHGTLSALGMISARYIYKIRIYYLRAVRKDTNRLRTLIIGAGQAASAFISETRNNPSSEYQPVGMVDDDKAKLGRRIFGVRIAGLTDEISEVAKRLNAQMILIAIPSADIPTRSRLLESCQRAGLPVKILPFIGEIDDGAPISSNIRAVTPDEMLGREPIKLAGKTLLSFLSGKTVVVTGGGGSIGSELCRQIATCSPKRLIIIDCYENNAYDIQQQLKESYGSNLDVRVYIASVRDEKRISAIFKLEKPDLLFHAAAHKHVPLMEYSPTEAVKNNIFGTLNTARAAAEAGIRKFIMVSTDKAVNPTNIMGATKRVAEMIVQSMNGKSDTVFAAVRFGNVLGSNGSVIPLFKRQIENGGPVTVTDPEVTRYFMTIPEAAQLVLTAGAMANGGEIFILDMGKPVTINDLARKLIAGSGFAPYIEGEPNLFGIRGRMIKYVGLRPGEKKFEELLLGDEGKTLTCDKKIYIGHQTPIDEKKLYEQLDRLKAAAYINEHGAHERIGGLLAEITGTYHLPEDAPSVGDAI